MNIHDTDSNETNQQVHAFPDQERALRLIESIENDARTLRQLLSGGTVSTQMFGEEQSHEFGFDSRAPLTPIGFMQVAHTPNEDDAIDGIFDGERMLDTAGKSYQVPPNYASKSKLVEGDPLKLYITKEGKYLYKQLGPVERITLAGTLRMEGNHYIVDTDDGASYNILTACVTYYMSLYNLKAGDRVMIMVPAHRSAKWAVIDNLI